MLYSPVPVTPVLAAIRVRLKIDGLVPTGTDIPPPRANPPETVLSVSALPSNDAPELFPVSTMPPPSPAFAVLPVIVALEADNEHRTQTMPPPFDAALAETVVLISVRLASAVVPVAASNEPMTAMPPPASSSPDSTAVTLPVTTLLFSVSDTPGASSSGKCLPGSGHRRRATETREPRRLGSSEC